MSYTIKTTNKALKQGLIDVATHKIIASFIRAQQRYSKIGKELEDRFNQLHGEEIKNSTTLEELNLIKEKLRMMPESVGKVFIFRDIIFKENEINTK